MHVIMAMGNVVAALGYWRTSLPTWTISFCLSARLLEVIGLLRLFDAFAEMSYTKQLSAIF
jgi:hypothetical protein